MVMDGYADVLGGYRWLLVFMGFLGVVKGGYGWLQMVRDGYGCL